MSKQEKKGLVPERRFPEFQDKGEWIKVRLGKLGELVSGLTYSPDDVRDNGLLVLRSSNVQNGVISLEDNVYVRPDIKGANLSQPGDILICVRNGSKPLIGKNALIPDGLPLCTHGAFMTVFRSSSAKFVYQLFQTSAYERQVAADLGATINSINGAQFKKYEFNIPKLENEKQKIADCLTSIDELVTAHTQKLDALKRHKKGLMQQLFPAEGETEPKLRFPEFRGKGGWVKENLGKLGDFVSGLTYSPDDLRDEGLLVLRSSNVQNGIISLEDNVYVKPDIKGANLSQPDDILICVRNGSKPLIGKNALIPKAIPLCTHGAFMTVFRSDSAKFVYQLFQTSAYERQVAADLGATINSINGSQFKKYEFYIPELEGEQKKITDFLSSIDEMIATQARRVDTLKDHKKGLMQQLFPVMDEVAG